MEYSRALIFTIILFLSSILFATNGSQTGPDDAQHNGKTFQTYNSQTKINKIKNVVERINYNYQNQPLPEINKIITSVSGEQSILPYPEKAVHFFEVENATAPGHIAILGADGGDSTHINNVAQYLVASKRFASVSIINGYVFTPSVGSLMQFDAVGVFGWFAWLDQNAIGDTLASFVDNGGNLLMAFASNSSSFGWHVIGQFEKDNHWLISPNSYTGPVAFSMGTVFEPDHPIMAGVNSFVSNSKLNNTSTVSEGAILLAEFEDGTPLAAYSESEEGGRRVDFSFPIFDTGAEAWGISPDTDAQKLVINTFDWLVNGGTTNVLVVSNNANENDWMQVNFEENISDIEMTTFDASSEVPTLEYLQSFDVVMLHESNVFDNSVNVGNRMYEFVMAGGNLVISTFYWQGRSDAGNGKSWGDLELIDPIYGGSCDYEPGNLDTESIIGHSLTIGLDSLYADNYRGGPDTLRENATTVAWWDDGDPLITFNKPAGYITAVTLFPAHPLYLPVSGDFYQLWDNVIKWQTTDPLPGVINVSPDSFDVTLFEGDTTSRVLSITNLGEGSLTWTTGFGLSAAPGTTEKVLFDITSNLSGPEAPFNIESQKSYDQKKTLQVENSIKSSSSGKILILRDGGTEITAEEVLGAAGFDVTLSNTLEYDWDGTNPSPDGFSTIVLLDGLTHATPMNPAGQAALVQFVESGGGLVFTEWIANAAASHNIMADLILLSRTTGADGTELYSVINNHPVVKGVADTFYVTTGTNVGVATSGTVLVTGSVAGDAVVVKEHESGRIVEFASGGNWGGLDPFSEPNMQKLLVNAVQWAGADGWLSTDIDAGTIAPGNTQNINVLINATNLTAGQYTGAININSNDPQNPDVKIPVNLQVDSMATDIDVDRGQAPLAYHLFQNFPNPFNPETSIQYQVATNQHVTLAVFDILGRKVKTLVDKFQTSGSYNVIWDGRDIKGNNAASGVYFYKMKAGRYENNKKLLLLK